MNGLYTYYLFILKQIRYIFSFRHYWYKTNKFIAELMIFGIKLLSKRACSSKVQSTHLCLVDREYIETIMNEVGLRSLLLGRQTIMTDHVKLIRKFFQKPHKPMDSLDRN